MIVRLKMGMEMQMQADGDRDADADADVDRHQFQPGEQEEGRRNRRRERPATLALPMLMKRQERLTLSHCTCHRRQYCTCWNTRLPLTTITDLILGSCLNRRDRRKASSSLLWESSPASCCSQSTTSHLRPSRTNNTASTIAVAPLHAPPLPTRCSMSPSGRICLCHAFTCIARSLPSLRQLVPSHHLPVTSR